MQKTASDATVSSMDGIELWYLGVDEMIQVGLKIKTLSAPLVRKGEHRLDGTSLTRCCQGLLTGRAEMDEGEVTLSYYDCVAISPVRQF